ncbi:MAG: ATP-binding cassette domain-containing protein [Acidimicrobiales bacterium]
MAGLAIEDLTIEYTQGDYVVRPIDGLNVTCDDGELVLLLGPSGSGKTTLLSCLAGILTPSTGRILVGDIDVTGLRAKQLAGYRRHSVGIIFQAFNLIPSLSARQNVAAPLRLAGVSGRVANAKAEELLAMVGLEERTGHLPRAMSGGQQQRVAIARALVHDPPLIVADEPTAHLDYVQVEAILRIIRGLARPGRLVVVATHDDRFTPLADRVIDLVPKPRAGAHQAGRVDVGAGEVLFLQGSFGDLVYVVEEGEVEVFRAGPDGTEHVLRRYHPGDYFGELGALAHLPRAASARGRTASVLSAYGPQEFRRLQASRHLPAVVSRDGP